MLDELHICNVALIRDANFAPGSGLTVITGETGAGKTALLSSLKLLAGERADSGAIRQGTDSLLVEGRFYLSDSPEEGDVVSRRVSASGRSRISLDGSPSSVKTVSERIGPSIDLCGQHEHQRLLRPEHQLDLLDAWAASSVSGPLCAYRRDLSRAAEASAEVERVRELANASEVELDRAQYVVDQIMAVDPQPGEYEELLEDMPRFEHAESLLRDISTIRDSLTADGGVLEELSRVLSSVEHIASLDESREPNAQSVRDAFFTLEDAWTDLSSYSQTIEFNPEELRQRQERIAAFQGLMRGFGPRMEDVMQAFERAQRSLSEHGNCDELLQRALDVQKSAEEALAASAAALDEARRAVISDFERCVGNQMARLHMQGSRIKGEFEPLPRGKWTARGPHSFQLLFAPGSEVSARPLNKIASGGELSRVMLACKVVIGDRDAADTLVFDEIDAGVGGSTASALADVLVDLARTHQVIVVTHLAQVAVRGAVHYLVKKSGTEIPETSLVELSGEERVHEIARMLSGDEGAESLAHARALLGEC